MAVTTPYDNLSSAMLATPTERTDSVTALDTPSVLAFLELLLQAIKR
jgi:hypothetical protein